MLNHLKQRKSLSLGIAIIFISLFISLLMAANRPTPKRLPPSTSAPTDVQVVFAEPQQHSPIVTTTAKVTAKRDIDLTAQVSGIITQVEDNYARGAIVQEGELLVTIDDQNYLTAVARAESEVATAEQALATEKGAARQAQREWRDLKNSEANDLFLRRPQIAAAEASLRSAKFNLMQAKKDLERTRVRAPFSGQISEIGANLGQYVNTGSPLARLVSTGYLEIAAPLTVNEINRLGLGRNQQLDGELQREVEVVYSYGFDEQGSAKGMLVRLDLVTDDETQVRHAIIEIQDEFTPINPGELVSVKIPGDAHPAAIWLPEQALYQRSELMTVVDEQLAPKEIKLLEARDGKILVTGLERGTPVVVERPFWSGPGTVVNIQAEKLSESSPDDQAAEEPMAVTDKGAL